MSEERTFRDVMGKFATGITVVTVNNKGKTRGITVNSFMSVSLSPQLIAVSIDKKASMYPFIQDAAYFGVSILSEEQKDIAQIFAKQKTANKEIHFTKGVHDTLIISEALGTIICQQKENIIVGDHLVVFGEVLSLDMEDKKPVLFFGGEYRTIND